MDMLRKGEGEAKDEEERWEGERKAKRWDGRSELEGTGKPKAKVKGSGEDTAKGIGEESEGKAEVKGIGEESEGKDEAKGKGEVSEGKAEAKGRGEESQGKAEAKGRGEESKGVESESESEEEVILYGNARGLNNTFKERRDAREKLLLMFKNGTLIEKRPDQKILGTSVGWDSADFMPRLPKFEYDDEDLVSEERLPDLYERWKTWAKKYGGLASEERCSKIKNDEYAKRFNIFKQSAHKIYYHNKSADANAKMALNGLADVTLEEITGDDILSEDDDHDIDYDIEDAVTGPPVNPTSRGGVGKKGESVHF